jgi:hypothetical protein
LWDRGTPAAEPGRRPHPGQRRRGHARRRRRRWLLRRGLRELRLTCRRGEHVVDGLDYPVLFGTTQAIWVPIDLALRRYQQGRP